MGRQPRLPSVMSDPLTNRGTAFTAAERDRLGLVGRLPDAVLTLDQQARRAYEQLRRQPDDLAAYINLEQLHDRNEVLYYRLLTDHLTELLPIVYDPTVGEAIKTYSHEYRRPRGVFLSIDRRGTCGARSRSWSSGRTRWTWWWSRTPSRSSASATGACTASRSPWASWRSTRPPRASIRRAAWRWSSTSARTTRRCSTIRCIWRTAQPGAR